VAHPDLVFDGPDNGHVSPYGSLVLAEDGEACQHLLSFSQQTGTPGHCAQPHRHTFAIRGPWERYRG
jgi:hypothetical protein